MATSSSRKHRTEPDSGPVPEPATGPPATGPEQAMLRMRDLVKRTGLPRETIHFYLTQGLLPKPRKTGRNSALYGAEHLERLQQIRELQERHFLPLRAIRAVLEEGSGEAFSEEQEAMLRRVRASLPPSPAASAAPRVAVTGLVPSKISRADLADLRRLGFVEVQGRGERASVSAEDASVIECWRDACALFRADEGRLTPDLLGIYDQAMEGLVDREARVLTDRFRHFSGERAVELIAASEPVLVRLLQALRRKKIAALLAGTAPNDE